ncbi:MAG TPA: L,D-transpeptidase [Acidimicrobiia bacterium]|jgi:hypothetical protein|nr:L,D-transpeptidase [Acidimicrobiia bacterium]
MTRTFRIALASLCSVAVAIGIALVGVAPAAASSPVTVRGFGGAPALGAPSTALNAPIVSIASTHSGNGYWLLGQDGGIFSYGDAHFYGSTGALRLNRPVVGLAATPSGHGYWLVASDGGIFSFGDAHFYGSTGAIRLNQPIVGMAATPSGHGYWLVASDGGIFSFGDAHFYGSTGGMQIGASVAGITTSPTGHGYWIVTATGHLYAFGDARPFPNVAPSAPITGVQVAPGGMGLWLVASSGSVYALGNAPYLGGAGSTLTAAVGITRAAHGYWIATVPAGPPLPANSGSGRRIVYSNHQQRLWLVEANGQVSHSWLVSGKHGLPSVGTYHVFAKVQLEPDGALFLPWTLKFAPVAHGVVDIHGIPLARNTMQPIEPDALLGTPESHGCVRMNQDAAHFVYDWAPVGTPVVVTDIG